MTSDTPNQILTPESTGGASIEAPTTPTRPPTAPRKRPKVARSKKPRDGVSSVKGRKTGNGQTMRQPEPTRKATKAGVKKGEKPGSKKIPKASIPTTRGAKRVHSRSRTASSPGVGSGTGHPRPDADHASSSTQSGFAFGGQELNGLIKSVAEKWLSLLARFSPGGVGGSRLPPLREFSESLALVFARFEPAVRSHLLQRLNGLLSSEILSPDSLKGLLWVATQTIEGWIDQIQRRRKGEYEIDEYGLDEELFFTVRPLVSLIYNYWFRVRATGVENVPEDGRALLVCNHSGVVPFDGAMVTEAIWSQHPSPRFIRWLFLKWFVSFPYISPVMNKLGAVLACPQNGERLLKEDRLVGVFPEGIKGIGKKFRDRYKLARFGRGGFIKICLKTRSTIVPVSVVGAEEIYPALTYAEFISKPLGLPYLPITPTFPWLGLLGLIPLPTRWHIHFGSPLRFKPGAETRADDYLVVSLLTAKVRSAIQDQIDESLRQRTSIF